MPGVYISFPFCAQKCSFCNFASGVFPRELEREYITALVDEIGSWCGGQAPGLRRSPGPPAGETCNAETGGPGDRRRPGACPPDTLYIGGGTPSRIEPDDLRRIVEAVPGRPWREATIEAAPGSLTRENVQAWADLGINRVSLGVQSFVKHELARTGRKHDARTVAADVALLREHGIDNINIDLIAGLPGQTPESWAESLDWIERLDPPHVSVYLFEIDEVSRLGLEVIQGGSRYNAQAVPDEALMTDLYETAVARLHEIGIERYEISNFANPGRESLHNLKYWRREPYIGFGADAHSFDGTRRYANVETAAEYVARWRAGQPFTADTTGVNAQEERFFVGLRLLQGIEPEPADYEKYSHNIDRLLDAGLLEREGPRIRLTSRGVLLSNEVFAEFLA